MASWNCPVCGRPFRHKNQAHSCVQIDAEEHLEGKDPVVHDIYRVLSSAVTKFGNVQVSSTKSSIMFVNNSTFLAVKPKRSWIDIEFLLESEVHEFPIYKTFRANKSRVAHFVRLETPRDVTTSLINHLRTAFRLAGR